MVIVDHLPAACIFYGGSSSLKFSVEYENHYYMVKLPFGIDDPKWEHIGSTIGRLLGLNVQDTMAGTLDNQPVTLCKDFQVDNVHLYDFRSIMNSCLYTGSDVDSVNAAKYVLDSVLGVLYNHPLLWHVDGRITHFWKMFIFDFLIGNVYRNSSEWGIIVNNQTALTARMAPIYDNCSCLCQDMSDEDIRSLLSMSREEFNRHVIKDMICAFKDETSAYIHPADVISSNRYPICTLVLKDLFSTYGTIDKIVEGLREDSGLPNDVIDLCCKLLAVRYNWLHSKANLLTLDVDKLLSDISTLTGISLVEDASYITAVEKFGEERALLYLYTNSYFKI